MSAIASFYVVPADRLTDIIAAATPTKRGWFRGPQDRFPQMLRDSGRALDGFAWSGYAFSTLDLYLDARHHFMTDRYGDATAGTALSKARGHYWQVLPAPAAAELLAALAPVDGETGDLTAFIASEHGPEDAAEDAVVVQAALIKLKAWLAEVAPQSVGLLSIA